MAAVTAPERSQSGRPGRRRVILGLVVVVAIAAGAVAALDLALGSPRVPAGAAATPIAVVENNSTVASVADPVDPASAAGPLERRACLERISRPAGSLHLCWTVARMTNETDPAHDDYILRVVGTLHGEAFPSGVRWAVIRAGPDAASAPFRIVDAWPGTTAYEGPCHDVPMALGFDGDETDTVCGRTVGEADQVSAEQTGLAWTCAGCLLAMSGDQPILLVARVTVDEGATPIWDLYADLGSS
jgi:hypothetical protein